MKRRQRRWHCKACGAAGWSRDGSIPPHDSIYGLSCRASGQVSEREAQKRYEPERKSDDK